MKALLTSLWQRRWCRLLGIALILCALPLLHPFVRQTIFGPTIEGVPWCVWENEIRYAADPPPAQRTWFQQQLATLGFYDQPRLPMERNFAALPVYLELAEDRDVKVRRFAVRQLLEWAHKDWLNQNDPSLPVLRRRLEDEDPRCRVWAAFALHRMDAKQFAKPATWID